MLKRTHTCGELRKDHIGESVNLNGWVNTVRLHGQVIFIDLRDRYGKTQIIFNSENYNGEFESAKKLSLEDVLSIKLFSIVKIIMVNLNPQKNYL